MTLLPKHLESGKWYLIDVGNIQSYYLCQIRDGQAYLRPQYCLTDCYWQSAESLLKAGMTIIGESSCMVG